MAQGRLTIAVDFGTTYSGVAYFHSASTLLQGNQSCKPTLIKDWGKGATSYSKTPTVLRYNGSDHFRGALGLKWGNGVKSHERRQEWFKLELDPMAYSSKDTVDFAQSYPSLLADPPDYARSAKTLCTDYLKELRKEAWSALEKKFTTAALRGLPVDWIITVPAVWSDKAKYDTLECAREAGIGSGGRPQIISEPEAAAAYVFQEMGPMSINVGENFIVCDAGGGTIDLVTYSLESLDPLEVEETVEPTGGKCGAVFVNRIFEKMVMTRIGQNSGLTDIGKHTMLKHFEDHSKREFGDGGANDTEEWYLPASGAKDSKGARIQRGTIVISAKDMKECFDPVVDEVIELVRIQISAVSAANQSVKGVILVGGFGESRYLQKRLREAIAPVNLILPPDQWGAVALGAVIQGVAKRQAAPTWVVRSRKATSHMGLSASVPYESFHDDNRKYWDDYEGRFLCRDVMQWFVNRGDTLQDSEPRTFEFYRAIRVKINTSLKITETLVYSLEDEAPFYEMSSTCRDHCTLKIDLGPVKDTLKQETGADGHRYYKVEFQILATFHAAEVVYQWRHNGIVYDKIKSKYI